MQVQFSVAVPEGVTQAEFEAWLLFSIGANGSLDLSNPMCDTSLSARDVTFQ